MLSVRNEIYSVLCIAVIIQLACLDSRARCWPSPVADVALLVQLIVFVLFMGGACRALTALHARPSLRDRAAIVLRRIRGAFARIGTHVL